METFAERFSRLFLKERGLTVEQVAAAMGSGSDAVRRLADGRTKQGRFDELLRLCGKYQVDPWFLAFGEERATQPATFSAMPDLEEMESRLPEGPVATAIALLRGEIHTVKQMALDAQAAAAQSQATAEEARQQAQRPKRKSA